MATPIPLKVRNAGNKAVLVKDGANTVYSYNVENKNSYPIYVKLYDVAAAGTPPKAGDAPAQTITVNANTTAYDSNVSYGFTNGIWVRCVTGSADHVATAPASPPVVQLNLDQASAGGGGSGFGTPQTVGDASATITRAGAVSTVVLTTTATAARVLTTPASPSDNDIVFIFDAADGGASTPTNTFSLRRNGSQTINGSASDVQISPAISGYKLFVIAIYHSASTNWNLDIVATPASKESISGLTTADNPLFNNVQVGHTTANSVNGSTAIDFNLAGFRTLNLSGNVTFTSSNLAAGKSVTRRIVADGSTRTLTFPGGWIFVQSGGAPANIAANKVGILTLAAFGATDADVVATWNVQP